MPVLFLHGFCETKEIWTQFIKPMGTAYRILTVDLPGFGESRQNPNYHSVEDMADEVARLIDALHLPQFIVVAHSLGGYVALALAERNPEQMAGLCLFHSTAFADTEEKKQTRNKTADFIEKNGVAPFIDNFVPPLFFKDRHEELKAEIERTREICLTTPQETAIAVTKAMRDRPDRTHVLQEATYPVLFIAGKADEAIPFQAAKEQFFLPNHAIVQVLARTGHMGMFEHPEETRQMVEKFVGLCIALHRQGSKL
jgi:pimeloyl-ACP methyl ester carboxylesterase